VPKKLPPKEEAKPKSGTDNEDDTLGGDKKDEDKLGGVKNVKSDGLPNAPQLGRTLDGDDLLETPAP
jgi:hypothetical protein